MILQAGRGLAHLHANNIIHGNIRAASILVTNKHPLRVSVAPDRSTMICEAPTRSERVYSGEGDGDSFCFSQDKHSRLGALCINSRICVCLHSFVKFIDRYNNDVNSVVGTRASDSSASARINQDRCIHVWMLHH